MTIYTIINYTLNDADNIQINKFDLICIFIIQKPEIIEL